MTFKPPEPFPGAHSQRCVKCEWAAEAKIARNITDGKWTIMAACLNPACGFVRELNVDPSDLEGLDSQAKWE